MGDAGKTPQRGRSVEVAEDLEDAQRPQVLFGFAHQRIDAPPAHELGQHAAHHVAATHDQQSSHRMIIAWHIE
jgi:hypothetical protein